MGKSGREYKWKNRERDQKRQQRNNAKLLHIDMKILPFPKKGEKPPPRAA